MNKKSVIEKTEEFVRKNLEKESSGHDWWHIDRVRKIAKFIARKEGGNSFVIELASLLHDVADWKFHGGDEKIGSKVARKWLEGLDVDESVINHVCYIMDEMPFKGAKTVSTKMKTLEGRIVQDADRLDAIGAIGIARCFAYGGKKGRTIHDPTLKPIFHKSFEEYKTGSMTSINHFYEKLLLLKGRMNTKTAKNIAENRHKFMKEFLERFFKEWKGKV